MLVAVWTNDSHHLFITSFGSHVEGGLTYLDVTRGPLYWFNVVYSYALLLACMVLLVRAFVRGAPLFRTQLAAFILGAAVPWTGNIITISGLVPLPGLDVTPLAFGLSGAVFYYALFRQRGFDLLPVARSRLIEEISDGLLVLDASFRVLDLNRAAEHILGIRAADVVARNASAAFPELAQMEETSAHLESEYHAELQGAADGGRYYDIKLTPLRNRQSLSGFLVLFRDISVSRHADDELRQTNRELKSRLREIESLHKKLRSQATRDPLTNLYNRRYLEEILEKEIARAARKGTPVSVIMMDADKFKRINDIYGHKAGDQALQTLARIIQIHIRRSDIACRYGGEEFVIVMPSTDTVIARGRAEEIRKDFEEKEIFGPGTAGRTSLSIGIAAYPTAGSTGEDVLDAADQAMYAAKMSGGNRIKVRLKPVKRDIPLEIPKPEEVPTSGESDS
jgi:diguanylate cyclase (GGDEF)-like protein/PAS domain S-box-containing protein